MFLLQGVCVCVWFLFLLIAGIPGADAAHPAVHLAGLHFRFSGSSLHLTAPLLPGPAGLQAALLGL